MPLKSVRIVRRRFSDVGDAVLMTAASRDGGLCRVALDEGRAVIALEPDRLMVKAASDSLDAWIADAAKRGMWARILAVGRSELSEVMPSSNDGVPQGTR